MENKEIGEFYTSDKYIEKNPGVHEEDSAWKVEKIIPFIDRFAEACGKEELTILDVGGGAGLVLREISGYLETKHGRKISKYCLDLSPGILDLQKKNNPDFKKAAVGDIEKTDFEDKEIDLLMMVDVLEHVGNPENVLREISRIANFSLFKVPLEDTLYYRVMDWSTRGRFRKRIIEKIGHINIYNEFKLTNVLEDFCGKVIKKDLTMVYGYLLRRKIGVFDFLFNLFGQATSLVSPALAAKIFSDYLVVLVNNYEKHNQ